MAISSVYINSGTWSGSDIITGINVRNNKNNIHIIDNNSVIVGLTTNTQAFTDSGSGYSSQNTYSNIGDIIGFNKEFILSDDLYVYNSVEPTSETRWVSGTNTKYSVNLGSLGSITNATFTSGINAIEALNEIRNSILALKNIKLIISNNTNSYTANNLKYPGCEELFIK